MFEKRDKFTLEHIQGLDCWVPPVGWVWDHFEGKMVETGVHRRTEDKKEQYWERTGLPKEYSKMLRREAEIQVKNPEYVDADLESFRRQEWFRRLNGFWFMNNGKPTYLTGMHYFYLNWWKIDIGYPHFRDNDREKLYFLQYCIEDPDCGGMLDFEGRGSGKTFCGGCFLFEGTSRNENKVSGIQSKTGKDAKETVYQNAVLEPFNSLPDFFVPVFDSLTGTRPAKSLRFFATNLKGKNTGMESGALNSYIGYTDAGERAYDGKKLFRYFCDEPGKTDEANVAERHRVIKFCIFRGGHMAGKALYSSSVEDLKTKDNIRQCLQLWNGSDPLERNDNNQTQTLLYRYFTPAYRSFRYDRYGIPTEEANMAHFMNIFADYQKKGDYKGLASERRKNPFTIEDVFKSGADNCLFDPIALNTRISELMWREERDLYDVGEFYANDPDDLSKGIGFRDKSNGRWRVRKFLDDPEKSTNFMNGALIPKNNHRFVLGVDPFDYKTFSDSGMSKAAAYLGCKYDDDEIFTESIIAEYYGRPEPTKFFKDMLYAAIYYGCKIMVEANKTALIQWFVENGYGNLLITLPGAKDPGISSSEPSKEMASSLVEDYFSNSLNKVFFYELLEEALDFDIKETEKFDRMMAFLWTVFAMRQIGTRVRVNGGYRDISQYIRTFKR